MSDQTIKCPKCGTQIELGEAFTHQIEERLRAGYDAEARKKANEYEVALQKKEKELSDALAQQRAKLVEEAKKKAQDAIDVELKSLKDDLADRNKKLDEARKGEIALRKRQRELEDRAQNLELEAVRKLDAEREKIRQDAAAKAIEENQLKIKERDLELQRLRDQIIDLQRKAEQRSQEQQGEAQEIVLESTLKEMFRTDTIEPVGKGKRGADVIQKVVDGTGATVGTIIWESKRTKTWGGDWTAKLKDDQRSEKAEIAVMVTETLPAGIKTIGQLDGVWVSDFASFIGLAIALRHNLIELNHARSALVGQQGKMEILYNYLSGPQFRQRVEGIVEGFKNMKDDLDSERRAMERQWAKRETQLQRVLVNTAGMYGDLQGIIGNALQPVQTLELPGAEG